MDAPEAFMTARHSLGKTRPNASAASSDNSWRKAFDSLGTTRVCPRLWGCDIEEGEHMVVLEHLVTGNISADDLVEQRSVVTHLIQSNAFLRRGSSAG